MAAINKSYRPLPKQTFAHPGATAYARQALSLSSAALGLTRPLLDISYGPEARHTVDIYRPIETTSHALPVLIFWHGGRWRAGYKEWNGFMAPPLCELPAVLVSPSYGLSPEYRFPTPLHDCFAALKWVYQNIANYGGDPRSIALGGHSAGGHLCALTTLRHDLYRDFGLPDNIVKACFPVSGTMTLDFARIAPDSEEQQIRSILLADASDAAQASPLRFVENNTAAFCLSYGENDFPRVISSTEAMASALRKQGGPLILNKIPECDHFQAHLCLQDSSHHWYKTLYRWLYAEV